jgi:polyhydroxyalkanoate synthesis regulator phasin
MSVEFDLMSIFEEFSKANVIFNDILSGFNSRLALIENTAKSGDSILDEDKKLYNRIVSHLTDVFVHRIELHQKSINTSVSERYNELERRIHSLEIDFINYTNSNPKTSISWTEERLRALEHQVKELKNGK